MPELTIREAMRLEEDFLGGINEAQDAYEQIIEHRAWTTLGYDSYGEWWQQRVVPIMRALSMRPTREITESGIEQVRDEEAALPPAQRRTNAELAEMFGASDWTVRGRQDQRQRRTAAGDDLGGEPPATAPDPDQPDDTPAEAPLPGLDGDGDDSRVPPSDEAASAPTPAAGGTPDGQTPGSGPSVPPGPASLSTGVGPGTTPASDPRADVKDAMRRHLRPDPDEPYREWREAFLAAMAPAFRLMAQFDVDHVVEQADDECLDELRRLAQEVGTYYEQVQAGRPAPNNVRHLRAV